MALLDGQNWTLFATVPCWSSFICEKKLILVFNIMILQWWQTHLWLFNSAGKSWLRFVHHSHIWIVFIARVCYSFMTKGVLIYIEGLIIYSFGLFYVSGIQGAISTDLLLLIHRIYKLLPFIFNFWRDWLIVQVIHNTISLMSIIC